MTTLTAHGKPLAGRWVRLDLLSEADLDEMSMILCRAASPGRAEWFAVTCFPSCLEYLEDQNRPLDQAELSEALRVA